MEPLVAEVSLQLGSECLLCAKSGQSELADRKLGYL